MITTKKSTAFIILGLFLLILFYLFSREVKNGMLKQTDFDTTVKLQERIDKSSRVRLASFTGNIFEGATFLASPEVSVVLVGCLTIAAVYDRKRKRLRLNALLIPVLFALLTLGEIYGKSVVHHPAPPFFMIKNPTTVFPKYYINESYSYPSGHAARAVFLGICTSSLILIHYSFFRRRKTSYCVMLGTAGYVMLVGMSRIYLGHHWLSDVLGGVFLGASLGLPAAIFSFGGRVDM